MEKPELSEIITQAFSMGREFSPCGHSIIELLEEIAVLKSDLAYANEMVANYLKEIRDLENRCKVKGGLSDL